MKEKIIKFFKEDRSYKGAVALYHEIGNSIAVKKQLNLQPESVMKEVLFDQMRILAGVSADDYKNLIGTAVLKKEAPKVKETFKPLEVTAKKIPAKKKAPAKKKNPPKK